MGTLQNTKYDHPSFTTLRQDVRSVQLAALGVLKAATFRSALKAIVYNIVVILESAGTLTQILTLLFNGSVAAVLTLAATANQNPASFTLTANRTMDTLADYFQVSSGTATTGEIAVAYQYRIVPQDITTFGTNLI